jgi:hypothetical protein
MNKTALAFIVILACGPRAGATDIAFYVGAPNPDGWYDIWTQFQDVGTIIAKTGHLFNEIRQFDDNQLGDFGAWVDRNTDDGEMDILWLNGCMPSVLYPCPNLQPDGSRIEKWLDGGNMVINVGDWFGYVSYEGGWWHAANLEMGAANILDLPSGVIAYADNTLLKVTPTGREYLPSLPDPVITYRPVVLSAVQPPWEVAAIFASTGGTDDPRAERWADPVVIHNTETDAYVAFIDQAGGGPAIWVDRGQVCAEFIANWVMAGAQSRSQARNPQPADGATGVTGVLLLCWTAGDTAVAHDVYFGTDEALVESADLNSPLYWGRQADARFSPAGPLQSGGRYFWRVDEVEADGATVYRGPVWSFTAFSPLLIDDFESYTDQAGHRIEEVWLDGSVNGTGAQVSRGSNPSGGGRAAGAHGKQSMVLAYDNTRTPFTSEVEREFVPPQDWTADGADTLSLWLKGDVVSFGETARNTYTMTAAGTDIWNGTDEFRYAFKRLDGDGSILARVDSLMLTNDWAKCGVMIRKSLEPYAAHASMFVTPDGRRAFQNRPMDWTGGCLTAHSYPGAVVLPCWVKVEREGNQFTGYYSLDGVNWILQPDYEEVTTYQSRNPETVDMPSYVYIGLALSSHAAGVANTAVFSGVEFTGDIIGSWQVADIGVEHPGNSPDDVYVLVEDGDGLVVPVLRQNPSAVNTPAWTEWKIPLSHFAGADLSRVKKMTIGVGHREIAPSLGTGRINIDDIRVSKQTPGSFLGIYLVDTDELVLSAQDMAAYLRATHEIVLNESGIEKWNSYVVRDSPYDPPMPFDPAIPFDGPIPSPVSIAGGLYQKEFSLRIDNREIYRGYFWSALSSVSCEGVVILDALLPCDSVRNTIQIENGYPGPLPGAEDPRDNAELLNFFAAWGLLK